MSAYDLVASEPWLITEEGLRLCLAIAGRNNDAERADLQALVARNGRPLMGTRRVSVRDGVAIVPVAGPIIRYATMFSEVSGVTSTQVLATDIRAALDDPTIHALVLDMNTPGGQVAGINELGDLIYQGRREKRIVAYAGHYMASAGYWIGSGAHEIVADRTSVIGSIGAVMTLIDESARQEKAGVRTIQIVSSQSPDKVLDPSVDASRAKLQKIVDDLAGVFVSAVARNRGVDEAHVIENFGRGDVMVGQAAVDAGLADRLGSLEAVVQELIDDKPSIRSFSMSNITNKQPRGPITVRTTTELRTAILAGHTAEEITLETVDVAAIKAEAVAAAQVEFEAKQKTAIEAAVKEATTKAATDATTAERARIAGLQAISVKGFEAEITKAIESGATVEATAVAIAKTQRERGVSVTSLRAGAPGAVQHGGAAPAGDTGAEKKGWGKISAKFSKKAKA